MNKEIDKALHLIYTLQEQLYGIYSNAYKEIFANGTGLSQYDKVCATICEEEYAELPF